MEVKWQKNAHILIKSESGYLKADSNDNIRRTSYLGRIWFLITDYLTGGKRTEQLNSAVQKTLSAVKEDLDFIKPFLEAALADLPIDEKILKYSDDTKKDFSTEVKETIETIDTFINELILIGKEGFNPFFAPDYTCEVSECLRDIPEALQHHSQINEEIKTDAIVNQIGDFFNLDFIESDLNKEFVNARINDKDKKWVG